MSFLYINPGYVELTDGPANGTTFSSGSTNTNSDYNPYNSLSFAFVRSSNDTSLTLNTGIEYWIKYGLASVSSDSDFNYINIVDSANNTLYLCRSKVVLNSTTLVNLTMQQSYFEMEVHVKSDSSNGIIEVWRDNTTLLLSYTGNVFSGNIIKYLNFNTTTDFMNEDTYLSNIIVRDTGRIGAQKIAILSAASIDTDMVKDSNNRYKTSVEGAHIYMKPDKTAFISSINAPNAKLKITGLMVGSTFGKYDSGNLVLADAYIKNTSTNQENLIDEHSLVQSASLKGVHANGFIKNPFTNAAWDLNDLDNIELGFKSKSST